MLDGPGDCPGGGGDVVLRLSSSVERINNYIEDKVLFYNDITIKYTAFEIMYA